MAATTNRLEHASGSSKRLGFLRCDRAAPRSTVTTFDQARCWTRTARRARTSARAPARFGQSLVCKSPIAYVKAHPATRPARRVRFLGGQFADAIPVGGRRSFGWWATLLIACIVVGG
jgi:hypothetical protein